MLRTTEQAVARTVKTPMILARQVGCRSRVALARWAKYLGAISWKDLRSARLSCFTMNRSSRVLAKKELLLPPRGSHLAEKVGQTPDRAWHQLLQQLPYILPATHGKQWSQGGN